jgi:FAD/FMN-containing dehydrogenase
MTDIGTTPVAPVLDSDALQELRAGFRGDVLVSGDPGYDEARQVFNGMFNRRPAAILRASGPADVIRAIGLARLSGLPLAIRSGGHSVAGFSSSEGGIVLDLRGLKGIRIDPQRRTVRVQGGVDWGQLDRETQQFGLALTGGRVSTTGVVGFTIGSGSGWLERKLGFACDSLVGADVVTADGSLVTANEDENADLLWGLMGGGGNFGVVTELEFRVHPIGPLVYGGLALFRPDQGRELLETFRDMSETAPDELGWGVASVTAPPEPFVPQEWQGKRMWGVIAVIAGSPEDGERLLRPIRALQPVVDLFQPMPYTVFQGLIDPANPYGRQNYWRAQNVGDLNDGAIDTLVAAAESIPSPLTAMVIVPGGGHLARVGADATALGDRSAPFNVHLNGMWEGAENDEPNIAWVRGVTEALRPYARPGMSLNFYTEIGDEDLRSMWGGKLDRLRELKARYDPTNLFRLNQNIQPAA